ncbi:MAG: signal peptidase II [Firmicutes bacterium]|nr:signal peptidase II [Bacillota bacterium]
MNKKTFIIAMILLIADQLSKSIVEIYLNLSESIKVINNFFYITVAHNTGGAWSILNNHSYIFIIASIVALVLLVKYMFSFKKNARNTVAFACLCSGIVSNLADRLFLGYVRDFLDFKIFGYDYPIFNIADIAIVVGVILLIIAIIKGEDRVEKSSK